MHEDHSSKTFWIKITAIRLSYELGLHGEKKFQWKLWNIIKNGHSEDDTFHTTSKTAENFKSVIFIMKVLP